MRGNKQKQPQAERDLQKARFVAYKDKQRREKPARQQDARSDGSSSDSEYVHEGSPLPSSEERMEFVTSRAPSRDAAVKCMERLSSNVLGDGARSTETEAKDDGARSTETEAKDDGPCEYELQRQRNIARNEAYLRELDLL